MLRFSLTTLLLLVLLAALSCAALIYASPLIQQIAVTAAVLIFAVAVLVALCDCGRTRAAAAGFAFVGWVYLLLANVGALNLQQHLLTGNANRWLYATLHPQPKRADLTNQAISAYDAALNEQLIGTPGMESLTLTTAEGYDGYQLLSTGADGRVQVWNYASPGTARQVSPATFTTIAHTLWALLLALLGAVAAAIIYARAHRAPVAAPASTMNAGRTA